MRRTDTPKISVGLTNLALPCSIRGWVFMNRKYYGYGVLLLVTVLLIGLLKYAGPYNLSDLNFSSKPEFSFSGVITSGSSVPVYQKIDRRNFKDNILPISYCVTCNPSQSSFNVSANLRDISISQPLNWLGFEQLTYASVNFADIHIDYVKPDIYINNWTRYSPEVVATYNITSVSAVPEPDTWFMLLTGIMAISTVMYRKK